jgi:DNA-binding transcriptional LysR family regulator
MIALPTLQEPSLPNFSHTREPRRPTGRVQSNASRRPSLSGIRSFLALSQHLHFGRAAKALAITQPALSNQINVLEQTLGVLLFERTTRQVKLSLDGERFLRRAGRILLDIDSAVTEISNPGAAPRGNVAFACIPTIAGHMFPRIITEFQCRHPEIGISMIDESTVEMERRIVNHEVDFGVGGSPRRTNELNFASIYSDPFVLVCRADHTLAKQRRVAIEKVGQFPCISLEKNSNVRQTTDNYFALAGHVFEPRYELIHHYTVGEMVEAGLGIALLPSQATAMMRASPLLKIIPVNRPAFARHVGLITRRNDPLSPAAECFYAFALTAMRREAPGGTYPISVTEAGPVKRRKRR